MNHRPVSTKYARAYRTARRHLAWREEYVRLARLRDVHPNVIVETLWEHRRRIGRLAARIARELQLRDLERRGIRVRA